MKSIFEYGDYRVFLADFYHEKKAQAGGYSYRQFADKAKLDSPNYLKLVIDGQRNLTVSNIHQFASALELNFVETIYFEHLVLLNQAKAPVEIAYYQQRRRETKALYRAETRNQPQTLKKRATDGVLIDPHYTATLVLLEGANLADAADKIAAKAGIAKGKVQQVIDYLLKNDLITVSDGVCHLSDQYLLFYDRKMRSARQKSYVLSQLRLASEVCQKRYEKDAKFYCQTFTVSEGQLAVLSAKIGNWLDALMAETNEQPPEQVMQLNIQLFPFRGS